MRGSTGLPQRVLIVGGSSEIGSALAVAWLERGTREFVLTQRAPGRADDLEELLKSAGAVAVVVELEAGDSKSIRNAIESAWEGGDVDVVVVALGVLGVQDEIEEQPELARRVLTVNAAATMEIGLHVAGRMEAQGHGTMVFLSSVAGQRGRRDNYVYGASKAALDTFVEGLQQRLEGSNVNALVVRPGYVHTRMSAGIDPAPFAVTVAESRDRIVDAVADGRAVVWVPSILSAFFFIFRLLPRRLWARIVSNLR